MFSSPIPSPTSSRSNSFSSVTQEQKQTTSTKKKPPLPITPRPFVPEKTLIYQEGQEKTQLVRPFTQEHLTYFLDERWTLNLSTANTLLEAYGLKIVFRLLTEEGPKTIHLESATPSGEQLVSPLQKRLLKDLVIVPVAVETGDQITITDYKIGIHSLSNCLDILERAHTLRPSYVRDRKTRLDELFGSTTSTNGGKIADHFKGYLETETYFATSLGMREVGYAPLESDEVVNVSPQKGRNSSPGLRILENREEKLPPLLDSHLATFNPNSRNEDDLVEYMKMVSFFGNLNKVDGLAEALKWTKPEYQFTELSSQLEKYHTRIANDFEEDNWEERWTLVKTKIGELYNALIRAYEKKLVSFSSDQENVRAFCEGLYGPYSQKVLDVLGLTHEQAKSSYQSVSRSNSGERL